jgi:hypothetical protein
MKVDKLDYFGTLEKYERALASRSRRKRRRMKVSGAHVRTLARLRVRTK